MRFHTAWVESGNPAAEIQAGHQQSESDPDLYRVPAAVRRLDPSRIAAIRRVGRVVPGAGMDRHRCLRLHGPAHAPLVRRTPGQADVQSLLRGIVVSGGFGVANGAPCLNSIYKLWERACSR